jgi:2-methylaconitate cis-trans-isomerase PrpF
VVSRIAPVGADGRVKFGHPSGVLNVGAEAVENDGQWAVTKVMMSRSARRLMEGWVRVPA